MKEIKVLGLSIIFLFIGGVNLQAQNQEIKGGQIHEAFMPVESQYTLLNAVPQAPPAPLQENPPQQTDPETIWVHGYWGWSDTVKDFVWCTGTWRKPPPGYMWIEGEWRQFDTGWVRLKGFWSPVPSANFTYISSPPPDQVNENPSGRPGNDYFWMAGYWNYEQNKYVWYSGSWEKLDPNWVYVPAFYAWRPEGYVFVPAYWDWPIETRGTSYPCVYISPEQRNVVYTPTGSLQTQELIESYLMYYPDYYYFFCHYYYYHIDWWQDYAWCPPWWAWDWWWLTWEDHWALWWWWVNPGYPAPVWLPHDVIVILYPPPPGLISAMVHIHVPVIVTPYGVVSPGGILNALGHRRPPILPRNPRGIQDRVAGGAKMGEKVRPSGPKIPMRDLQNKPQALPQTKPERPQPFQPGKQPSVPSRRHLTPPRVQRPPTPTMPTQPPSTPGRPDRPTQPPSTPGQPQPSDPSVHGQVGRPTPPSTSLEQPAPGSTGKPIQPPATKKPVQPSGPASPGQANRPIQPPASNPPSPRPSPAIPDQPGASTPPTQRLIPPPPHTPTYAPPSQGKSRKTPPPNPLQHEPNPGENLNNPYAPLTVPIQ